MTWDGIERRNDAELATLRRDNDRMKKQLRFWQSEADKYKRLYEQLNVKLDELKKNL